MLLALKDEFLKDDARGTLIDGLEKLSAKLNLSNVPLGLKSRRTPGASAAARLAARFPVAPIAPSAPGWSNGKDPLPACAANGHIEEFFTMNAAG